MSPCLLVQRASKGVCALRNEATNPAQRDFYPYSPKPLMNGVNAFAGTAHLSSQIQLAQSDLIVAMRAQGRRVGSDADKILEGAMQCLRNLVVPQTSLDEVRKTNTTPEFPLWVGSGHPSLRPECLLSAITGHGTKLAEVSSQAAQLTLKP